MEWEERYRLGYGPMDEKHQEFVMLVTELSQTDKAGLPALLDKLIEHTTEHFASEERLMLSCGFTTPNTHTDEHNRILATLGSAKRMLGKGFAAPARALEQELPGWFANHAATLDSVLAAQLLQQPEALTRA